jgi:acetyl-CoA acetyltransferase
MSDTVIVGIGIHPWGKFNDKPLIDMLVEATQMALKDAGMEWKDIRGISAGSSRFSGGMGWGLAGNEVAQAMGETGVPIINVSAACATGAVSCEVASMMINNGMCDIALAVAGEKMPKGFIPRTPGAADDITDLDFLRWRAIGAPNPAYWAMGARRRMHDFGTTELIFAKSAVKAHKNGVTNPNARYRKAISLEEVINSPYVSYPLRLLEICAVSDGAAAAILCSKEVAKKRGLLSRAINIAAISIATRQYGDPAIREPNISMAAHSPVPPNSETVGAVKGAYEKAGIGPKDIDFVEIQDNSAWHELEWLECFEFCKPGEADWLMDHGELDIGGKLPVNPSGGFQSFGEATTAMGLWHIYELTRQLRGEAGPNQVKGAKVGLSQTIGLAGNSAGIILKR